MAETNTFETLDAKALHSWVVEKNEEIRRYIDATKGTSDDDRLAIIDSRTKELYAAQELLQKKEKVEEHYQRLVAQKKAMSEVPDENRIPFESGNGDGQHQQQAPSTKSLGEMFIDSHAYKSIGKHSPSTKYDVLFDDGDAIKTVMTTAAGAAVPNVRIDKVIPYALRSPRMTDVIPVTPTAEANIDYLEETTSLAGTNAQVAVSENATKFENTLAFTVQNAKQQKVATALPVTDEQLDDVPGMRAIIDNRLTQFLQLKEEDILLTGTGTPPQMTGFLVKSGVNAIARTTESNIDMIWKLMQACRVTGFAEPDAIVMHPTNLDPIVLYKDSGGTFQFNPLTEQGGVMRLFGKPIVLTTAITLNTALVGAFGLFSEIRRKMGLRIEVGFSGTDFVNNRRTILAEFREALLIYRASAFAKGTNLQ